MFKIFFVIIVLAISGQLYGKIGVERTFPPKQEISFVSNEQERIIHLYYEFEEVLITYMQIKCDLDFTNKWHLKKRREKRREIRSLAALLERKSYRLNQKISSLAPGEFSSLESIDSEQDKSIRSSVVSFNINPISKLLTIKKIYERGKNIIEYLIAEESRPYSSKWSMKSRDRVDPFPTPIKFQKTLIKAYFLKEDKLSDFLKSTRKIYEQWIEDGRLAVSLIEYYGIDTRKNKEELNADENIKINQIISLAETIVWEIDKSTGKNFFITIDKNLNVSFEKREMHIYTKSRLSRAILDRRNDVY